jgi:phosphoenolpyruvate-protein kinase (PTS system EI component)
MRSARRCGPGRFEAWFGSSSRHPDRRRITADGVAKERLRLGRAIEAAAVELEGIAERIAADGHGEEAAIFAAQAAIARDPALLAMSEERIGRFDDAIAAIQAAAEGFAEQLRSLDDELLAARAADVTDVGHRIARHVAGLETNGERGLDRSAIVVADDLPPSITATLPRDRLVGICLEGSSATAHAAILARAYGIPAVVGVPGLLAALRGDGGTELAIDGDTGEVVLDPDEPTRTRFDRGASRARRHHLADVGEPPLQAVTADGVEVALPANIGTPDECVRPGAGAHGVGLFRTEFSPGAGPPRPKKSSWRRIAASWRRSIRIP